MRPSSKNIGRRLTPKQAAKTVAQGMRQVATVKRYVATVASVTDRETTGTVACTCALSSEDITVQVRANVDLAADDVIWIRHDPSVQDTFIFDGFVKGGGTGNNAADAPIPWTQTPGVTSPTGADLTITAPAGQTTIIGSAGEAVQFDGDVDLALDELTDVNAAAPSDKEVLTWVDGSSEWQATDAGWKLASDDLLVVGAEGHYTTVALAIAAAAAGDTILLDIGTWTCDNQTLPDGVNLIGVDKDACILRTTSQAGTLTIGNGCYVANLTIQNEWASDGGTIAAIVIGAGDTCELFNVKIYANNTSGTATGAWGINNSGTLTLRQCEVVSTGAAGGLYGLVNANDVHIYGGSYVGDTAAIYNVSSGDNAYFEAPPKIEGGFTNNGTASGYYTDADGDLIGALDDDIFPDGDTAGLATRSINFWFTPNEFFRGDFLWLTTGWAGAPFNSIPSSVDFATTSDVLRLNDAVQNDRFFRYRTVDWTIDTAYRIAARLISVMGAEAGIRIDTGDDTDFVEMYVKTTNTGLLDLVGRWQENGGGITTTTAISQVPIEWYMLSISCGAPNAFYGYAGIDTPAFPYIGLVMGDIDNWSSVPTRVGIIFKRTDASSSGREGFYDWFWSNVPTP